MTDVAESQSIAQISSPQEEGKSNLILMKIFKIRNK